MRWLSARRLGEAFVRRRRTLGLGAFALMAGMLFWGRLLLQDVPRTAIADPELAWAPQVERKPGVEGLRRSTLPRVGRDLFGFEGSRTLGELDQVNEKNWGAEQKSAGHPVDEQQRREKVIREAAAHLSLEQTWLGARPRARISGRLVSPGQSAHGFLVRNIRNGKVVLQKDDIVIVLEM